MISHLAPKVHLPVLSWALWENRALREEPGAEVPGEARQVCLKTIFQAYRKRSF